MIFIINVAFVLLTVLCMEGFSWTIHKYLFHGPLWFIHESHHKPHSSWFELNDIFSVIFAGLSLYLMWQGSAELSASLWIGIGISMYGLLYFIFHDGFIHNRFDAFSTTNRYLLGIRRAHKIHHKSVHKDASEEFGLLLASAKHFKKQVPGQTRVK